MTKCPFCKEEIQDDAIKCKHCGEILKKEEYSKSAGSSAMQQVISEVNNVAKTARAMSLRFDLKHLGLGEKIVLASALAALLSLFLPWVAMGIISSSGWNQQGYLFCLLFVYPVIGVFNVKGLNRIAGIICGVLALIISIWYIADKHYEIMGVTGNASASGLYLFTASTIGLIVGAVKYKQQLFINENHPPLPSNSANSSVPPAETKTKWMGIVKKLFAGFIHVLVVTGRIIGRCLSKLLCSYSKASLKLVPEKVRSPFVKMQPLSGRLGDWFELNLSKEKKALPIMICAITIFCLLSMSSNNSRIGSATKSSRTSGSASSSQGESAEAFVKRIVEERSIVAGGVRATATCGPNIDGSIEFFGDTVWRSGGIHQSIHGTIHGKPGDWNLDGIVFGEAGAE